MTKEDFIKKYLESAQINKATTLFYAGIVDLLEEIYEREFSDKWISVKDKMPGRYAYQYYTVYRPDIKKESARVGRIWWNGQHFRTRIPVTHWMPLPAPPEDL